MVNMESIKVSVVLLFILSIQVTSSQMTTNASFANKNISRENTMDRSGISIQKEVYENEFRVNKLESTVGALLDEIAELRNANIVMRAEMKATKTLLDKCISRTMRNSPWKLKRIDMILPKMTKLQLHQTSPLIVEKLPLPFPESTKALIVYVFCNFWNNQGHAYLIGEIQQKGNADGGAVKIFNQHFNVYANTWSNEVFVPWDTALPNELQMNVKSSYHTGGNNNWYDIKIVGYIVA